MSYSHNGALYHGTRLDSKYEPAQKTNTVSEVNEVSETIKCPENHSDTNTQDMIIDTKSYLSSSLSTEHVSNAYCEAWDAGRVSKCKVQRNSVHRKSAG